MEPPIRPEGSGNCHGRVAGVRDLSPTLTPQSIYGWLGLAGAGNLWSLFS